MGHQVISPRVGVGGPGIRCSESGVALLIVIVLLVAMAASSASFVWFMNRQQARAGLRYRTEAALPVAEAGVHRALAILESVAPDGWSPGRSWRPAGYSERLRIGPLEGRYVLSLVDDPDGSITITSTGDVAGVTRGVRARVYLASPALLAALYAASAVRLEDPPAATFILPYGAGIGDRPWIHVGVGRGIWFATSEVSINEPTTPFEVAAGPVDPAGVGAAVVPLRPGPVRLLLARGAELTLGWDRQRVDVQHLRAAGVYVEGVVLRAQALPPIPEVDRAYYQGLAAGNTANAALHEAAGHYVGDLDLARKRDSLYSAVEFERLQRYLKAEVPRPRLHGVVYVRGGVSMTGGQSLEIRDGTLVAESTVHLIEGSTLELVHSAATRRLPAILVLDQGALVVTNGGRLRAHGLVYVSRVIDIGERAHVDIVGAVLGNDPRLSFRNLASTVVIRYDPAVLGTPGLLLRHDAVAVAWVAAWEDLR
ncbi:MAG: hypothetical protein ACRDIC_07555 [bacterium]